MREKIKAGGHKTPYRLRKQLPEPVFGQMEQARGFRQFLMRGLDKVAHEMGLVGLAHNMLKLAQGRSLSAAKLSAAGTPPTRPYRPKILRPELPIPSKSQQRRTLFWTGS